MCKACRPGVQRLSVAASVAGFDAVTGDSSISSNRGDAALLKRAFPGVSVWAGASVETVTG